MFIKFVCSCLSYLGWIGLGENRLEFNSVWIISGSDLHQVNKSSSQFGFRSVNFGLWVKSGQQNFGSVQIRFRSYRIAGQFGSLQFRVGSVLDRFNFKFRVEIGSTLSHVSSGQSDRITFVRSKVRVHGGILVGGSIYEVVA